MLVCSWTLCVCVFLGGVNLVDVGFGIGFIYKAGREPFSVNATSTKFKGVEIFAGKAGIYSAFHIESLGANPAILQTHEEGCTIQLGRAVSKCL